jgi:hypothetical protein
MASTIVAFYWSSLISLGMDGNLWIADPEEHTIKLVSNLTFSDTNSVIYSVLGTANVPGFRLGDYTTAQLNAPISAVLYENSTGQYLFIADTGNHCLKLFHMANHQVEVFAGTCRAAGFMDGPFGTNKFNSPEQIGFTDSHLFIVDRGNRAIRMVDMSTRNVQSLKLEACSEASSSATAKPIYSFDGNIFTEAYTLPIHTMNCDTSLVLNYGSQIYNAETDPRLRYCLQQTILCGDRTTPFIHA